MGIKRSVEIVAHNNIYTGSQRKIRVECCIPEKGIDSTTSIVMIVPGFGGNIDSNVYKKMREKFSDQYNMISIQCDYFGSKYMQHIKRYQLNNTVLYNNFNEEEINILVQGHNDLLKMLEKKQISIEVEEILDETLEEFNDMSFMQAIDIITSIEFVKRILEEGGIKYDSRRVIGYGYSHGAYLLHLSNILSPHLFSYIVDNSAWISPEYLINDRVLILMTQDHRQALEVRFSYLAKQVVKNKKDLSLVNLYKHYKGGTQIIAFQGNDDVLVDYKKKKEIIESIKTAKFILVSEEDVDHKKYGSNGHGLNADFLELFAYALAFEEPTNMEHKIDDTYVIDFEGALINVNKNMGISKFQIEYRN